MHLRGSPAAGDGRAVDHLLQHPGTPAGGVLLLAGGQVRRAHHPAGRGVVGAALADAGAAVHRLGEITAVVVVGQRQVPAPGSARGSRRSASSGRGSTITPGLRMLCGSNTCLTAPNSASRVGGVHQSAAVRRGPGRRRAPRTASRRTRRPGWPPRSGIRETRWLPPGFCSGKSIRMCRQPSPKWP